MPWVSRDTLRWYRERDDLAHQRALELREVREREAARRAQVRHLRKTIHRLRADVGRAVNIAVREAHVPLNREANDV